jgi:hypothetical protein
LGFRDTADAFVKIIQTSEPRFAVGIFGGWGSGKTTLMGEIKARLPSENLVIVDFNAWRFEREPQLLVPLLDTLRFALISWAEYQERAQKKKARACAARVGTVVRALATGLSAQVGLPGAATVSYNVAAGLDALSRPVKAESPQSLYFAAFKELENAFREFEDGGINRIVVFVDDLDRCLPENALQVLESMKLFFDLKGFVFVVGLDQDIVEQSVQAKFSRQPDVTSIAGNLLSVPASRLGREYVKKIFQVPYSLPAVYPEELEGLLESMLREALNTAQAQELQSTVLPYLRYVVIEGLVNPREVKRFVNAYIVQMLIKPKLKPRIVLALLTLAFQAQWALLYKQALTNPAKFLKALKDYEVDKTAFGELSPDLKTLPPNLSEFLVSDEAGPLTMATSLDKYLSSLESTSSSTPWIPTALPLVGNIIDQIRLARDGDPSDAAPALEVARDSALELDRLLSRVGHGKVPEAVRALPRAVEDANVTLGGLGADDASVWNLLNDLARKAARAHANIWASLSS